VVQRPILYLGEINDGQREAWCRQIEPFDEASGRHRQLALIPIHDDDATIKLSSEQMVSTEHTHKAFDADLQELSRMIAEMGGLAEREIGDAIDALNRRDAVLSRSIIAEDAKIDLLQREIEEKAILTIARRQPMAIDLREVVGALRVSNDLERIGDLAKNIAKRVMVLDGELNLQKVMRGVEHMTELVLTQIKDVLDAYSRRDVTKALQVWRGDEEVDAVNNSLFRELLTYMMEDPRNISVCIHLLFCAKNIERMGDHATNIAETVYYMVEGKPLPDERPKGDSTSTTRVPYRL
jgi:phosphate transport system protein